MTPLYERVDFDTDPDVHELHYQLLSQQQDRLDSLNPEQILMLRQEADLNDTTDYPEGEPAMTTTHNLTEIRRQAEANKLPDLVDSLSFADICTNLASLDDHRKGIYRSLIRSLNWSIIAFAEKHVKADGADTLELNNPTIDNLNDEMADLAKIIGEREHTYEIGFDMPRTPYETMMSYAKIRKWLEIEIEQIEKNEKLMRGYTIPPKVSIALSATLTDMCKIEAMPTKEQIESYAAANGMLVEHAAVALNDNERRKRALEMRKLAVPIARVLAEIPDYADTTECSDAFDSLTFTQQLKLWHKAVRFIEQRMSFVAKNISMGKSEELGAYHILMAQRNTLINEAQEFMFTHPAETNEFAMVIPHFADVPNAKLERYKEVAAQR